MISQIPASLNSVAGREDSVAELVQLISNRRLVQMHPLKADRSWSQQHVR